MKTFRAASFLMLISLATSNFSLFAQENVDETIEIGAIHIIYENFKTVDRAFVLSHIRLREGGSYNRLLSDQSLRSLYDTNYFEFVDFRISAENGIFELNIYLTAKYKLKEIGFSGNQKFSARYLLEIGELKSIFILDEYEINTAAKKISETYFKKGYRDTSVTYNINRNVSSGYATVDFEIVESERARIKDVKFDGVTSFKSKTLKKVMESKSKNMFSWLTGSGNFDQLILDEDLNRLRLFYQNLSLIHI